MRAKEEERADIAKELDQDSQVDEDNFDYCHCIAVSFETG